MEGGSSRKRRARVDESQDAFRELVIFLSGAGISVRHWQMWDNLKAARPVTNPEWNAQSRCSGPGMAIDIIQASIALESET